MGNPSRYFFEGRCCGRPQFEYCPATFEGKTVAILGQDYKDFYETAVIDFYSAPDVITPYTNGNDCKDEFRRYGRYVFSGLKRIAGTPSLLPDDERSFFPFESVKHLVPSYDDPLVETDIPIGKFAGMSYEQVQEYKRQNQCVFAKSPPARLP